MIRPLVVGAFVLGVFGLAAACRGPVSTPGSNPTVLTEAQATDVRRTAVADVQRIIANNPTATPPPAPTSTPAPTCKGAIWWNDARTHLGEQRAVEGRVRGTRPFGDRMALLEIGQSYPDPIGFVIVAPVTSAAALDGKMVCATGKIVNLEGVPGLMLPDASAILILPDQQ